MELVLLSSFVVAYLLLVWFETSAFVVYAKKLGLEKWIVLPDDDFVYIDFLKVRDAKPYGFFVKLLSCPICLSFWLSLPFLFLTKWFLAIAFLGVFFYLLTKKILESLSE